MFLQDLRSAIMSTTMEFNTLKQSKGDVSAVEARLNALNEVWQYIKSGLWTDNAETAYRVTILVTKPRDIAVKELGLNSKDHARMIMSRANKVLGDKFGDDFVNRLLTGDLNKLMLEFRVNSGTLLSTGTFLSEACALLPQPSNEKVYTLGECISEAKLLAFYSKAVLEKRFASVDQQKLAYLVFLLNTYDPVLHTEQKALYDVITGEANANDLAQIVNPLNSAYEM